MASCSRAAFSDRGDKTRLGNCTAVFPANNGAKTTCAAGWVKRSTPPRRNFRSHEPSGGHLGMAAEGLTGAAPGNVFSEPFGATKWRRGDEGSRRADGRSSGPAAVFRGCGVRFGCFNHMIDNSRFGFLAIHQAAGRARRGQTFRVPRPGRQLLCRASVRVWQPAVPAWGSEK